MKKLLLLLSLSVFLFSCGDDDNDAQKNIIGYWKFEYASPVEVVTNSEANTQKVKDYIRRDMGFVDWEFKEDGIAIDDEGYTYKYSINGNKLTTIIVEDGQEDGDPYTTQFEVDDDKLIIYEDYTDDYKWYFPDAGVTKAIIAINYVRR